MFVPRIIELNRFVEYLPFLSRRCAPDLESGRIVGKYQVEKYLLCITVCTFGAGIGSEFLQKIVSGGLRKFDLKDILSNVLGSLFGIGIEYFQSKRRIE